jgi:type I restriction enzyme S subunit
LNNTQLPNGWIKTKLEKLTSDISYGYTASSNEENIGPKMLRITDIQDNKVNWSTVPYCQIEDNKLEKYSLKANDLVFARTGATVGKSFLIKNDVPNAVYASYLIRVRCISSELVRFLSYFFNSKQYWLQITEFSAGIGQPNVNGTKLKSLDVVIPPLAEQKEIATLLDNLLAQVDTLKTRLDTIPNILKRFRQSVLAAAVSGKLTEEWRTENAKHEWEYKTIGDVCAVATGKTPSRSESSYWDNGTVPWLTSAATGDAFTVYAKEYITVLAASECQLKKFEPGTLLLAMYGEGKTRGQVTELKLSATCNQACAAIIVNESIINRKFVKIRLQENYEETRKAASGGNQPNLNLSKVREIPIPLPSLEEQEEIVRRVEELFAFADQIEQRVKTAQQRVNHLTQAILAKAFRGELTAEWREQNPDLISGENSAAALLARIKTDRKK